MCYGGNVFVRKRRNMSNVIWSGAGRCRLSRCRHRAVQEDVLLRQRPCLAASSQWSTSAGIGSDARGVAEAALNEEDPASSSRSGAGRAWRSTYYARGAEPRRHGRCFPCRRVRSILFDQRSVSHAGYHRSCDWRYPKQPQLGQGPSSDEQGRARAARRVHRGVRYRNAD